MAHIKVIFLDFLGPKGHIFQQILHISGAQHDFVHFPFFIEFSERAPLEPIFDLLWRSDTPASNKQPP